MKNQILSVLVKNYSGVTARVSNTYGRMGLNMTSFTGSTTHLPKISRLTIAVDADNESRDQLILQTQKLEETIDTFYLDPETAIVRDLFLAKLKLSMEDHDKVLSLAKDHNATVLDSYDDILILELVNAPEKIDAFLDQLKETFMDREGDDIHLNDTMEELTSLSNRFGLIVTFSKPNKKEFLYILRKLAEEEKIQMPEEVLIQKAEAFALRQGGRSPRVAKQYIDYLKTLK